MKRGLHAQLRELKRSPDGRAQYGLGLKLGYWPCIYAPFISIVFWRWRAEIWYGLPSYWTQLEGALVCEFNAR